MLITSEIDALDDKGDVVELKSTNNDMRLARLNSVLVQLACNGSRYLLLGGLNQEKSRLEKLKWIEAADLLEQNRPDHISNGQRVKFLRHKD